MLGGIAMACIVLVAVNALVVGRLLEWRMPYIGALLLVGLLLWCVPVALLGVIQGAYEHKVIRAMVGGEIVGVLFNVGLGTLLYRLRAKNPTKKIGERLMKIGERLMVEQDTGEMPVVEPDTPQPATPEPSVKPNVWGTVRQYERGEIHKRIASEGGLPSIAEA